jgi:hypothetical protein
MLGVSKLCSPRQKARDVLLRWARASAYEDRAVEYAKMADVAPDRNVRNRFIAITRHYRTLAQIERRAADETASHSHQSQETIVRSHCGSFTSLAFVLLTIISGATTTVTFDLARAGDCLAAPSSPAPKGIHWYYHLNRATQQKCWYVRSSEKQHRHATVQTTSADAAMPPTNGEQLGSSGARDIDRSSGQPEPSTAAIQEPASSTTLSGSASQPSPPENRQAATAPQENALSDANGQPTVPTAVVWPDPPPITRSVNAGEAIAATASDDPAYPVSDTTDSVSRNGERNSTFEIPIAIFPAFAFGLVVIGFAVRFLTKDAATRPAQEVDQTTAVTILDDDHIKSPENRLGEEPTGFGADDFKSFVSAVSGRGPFERIVGSVHPANEISAREARLAQLREDIGQRLGWAEPTRQYPSKQKVAS